MNRPFYAIISRFYLLLFVLLSVEEKSRLIKQSSLFLDKVKNPKTMDLINNYSKPAGGVKTMDDAQRLSYAMMNNLQSSDEGRW